MLLLPHNPAFRELTEITTTTGSIHNRDSEKFATVRNSRDIHDPWQDQCQACGWLASSSRWNDAVCIYVDQHEAEHHQNLRRGPLFSEGFRFAPIWSSTLWKRRPIRAPWLLDKSGFIIAITIYQSKPIQNCTKSEYVQVLKVRWWGVIISLRALPTLELDWKICFSNSIIHSQLTSLSKRIVSLKYPCSLDSHYLSQSQLRPYRTAHIPIGWHMLAFWLFSNTV